MAQRRVITIIVDYDSAHRVPSDEDLKKEVEYHVNNGLLVPHGDSVIETWNCTVDERKFGV